MTESLRQDAKLVNAYNPNTQKAEASGGQHELHGEFKATLQSLMFKKKIL